MASVETIKNFLGQHHDVMITDDVQGILARAGRYGKEVPLSREDLILILGEDWTNAYENWGAPAEIGDPETHNGAV